MRNHLAKIIIVIMPIIVMGCSSTPDHSNTLIFATSTKFALDVSVTPTGSPDFTLGYKRVEGVWMPLLANKKTNGKFEPADCATTNSGCKFQAEDGSSATKKKVDAYSVFASFGADFSGGGEATVEGTSGAKVKASGGLAQFFATGIAAQNISDQDPSRLVSVQPVDREMLENANQRAEKAEKAQQDQLKAILGEKYQINLDEGKKTGLKRSQQKVLILHEVAPQDKFNKKAWEELIKKAEVADKDTKKNWDLTKLKTELTIDSGFKDSKLIEPLFKALQQ